MNNPHATLRRCAVKFRIFVPCDKGRPIMDIIDFREYCMRFPCVEETLPFDDVTLCYKVAGRIFAAADMESFDCFVVKTEPAAADELRERYPEITAARHWNSRWWCSVSVVGDLPDRLLRRMIDDSYVLTVRRNVTPRALRDEIQSLSPALFADSAGR